jgi:outer membrane protein assembly factor BamB
LRYGKGNAIAADGKLFLSTMEGELVVVQPSPDKYIELGRKEVLGMTRQAPALAAGRLYLRDDAEIVCLDVRRP